MTTMSFFANRAARTNAITGNLNLSSLTEMAPALVVALVCVAVLNFLV